MLGDQPSLTTIPLFNEVLISHSHTLEHLPANWIGKKVII